MKDAPENTRTLDNSETLRNGDVCVYKDGRRLPLYAVESTKHNVGEAIRRCDSVLCYERAVDPQSNGIDVVTNTRILRPTEMYERGDAWKREPDPEAYWYRPGDDSLFKGKTVQELKAKCWPDLQLRRLVDSSLEQVRATIPEGWHEIANGAEMEEGDRGWGYCDGVINPTGTNGAHWGWGYNDVLAKTSDAQIGDIIIRKLPEKEPPPGYAAPEKKKPKPPGPLMRPWNRHESGGHSIVEMVRGVGVSAPHPEPFVLNVDDPSGDDICADAGGAAEWMGLR